MTSSQDNDTTLAANVRGVRQPVVCVIGVGGLLEGAVGQGLVWSDGVVDDAEVVDFPDAIRNWARALSVLARSPLVRQINWKTTQ